MSQPTDGAGEEPRAQGEAGDDGAGDPRTIDAQDAPRAEADEAETEGNSVVVRYGLMRNLGEFLHNIDPAPPPGRPVVVRTDRGVELGEVVLPVSDDATENCISHEALDSLLEANGPEYPFRRTGKVLRLANQQDIIDQRHLDSSALEEGIFCRQQIDELGMDMKLVTVEHLLGGERIVFYFSAEHRVDFRELVRRLAGQYRTRIEMRQVGARDEAKLVADFERCGRRCCCQQFLKDLKPVSMRMAKMQKATLDPTKISGRCGRLMCCLRYEDAGYEELREGLPKKNTYVRTQEVAGRVVDTQILTQLVRLELADRTFTAVSNEDIIERNVDPSVAAQVGPVAAAHPVSQPSGGTGKASVGVGAPREPRSDWPEGEGEQPAARAAQAQPEKVPERPEGAQKPTKKRRRGGRRRKPRGHKPGEQSQAQAAQPGTPGRKGEQAKPASQAGQTQSDARAGSSKSRRRRRRRRKKKPK